MLSKPSGERSPPYGPRIQCPHALYETGGQHVLGILGERANEIAKWVVGGDCTLAIEKWPLEGQDRIPTPVERQIAGKARHPVGDARP